MTMENPSFERCISYCFNSGFSSQSSSVFMECNWSGEGRSALHAHEKTVMSHRKS